MPAATSFQRDLVTTMTHEICCQQVHVRNSGGKFILVNAWNEWGEGMALEPSDAYGKSLLEAVKTAKAIVDIRIRSDSICQNIMK